MEEGKKNTNDIWIAQDEPCKESMPNTELFVGTKIVKGVPMTERDFFKNIKKEDISNRETYGDGYMVTYEDGYVSWSPKRVFEQCYRLLSDSEIRMAKNINQ